MSNAPSVSNATLLELARRLIDSSTTEPSETPDHALDNFLRPEAFARRYPDLVGSKSRLQYLLRFRNTNGLKEAGAVIQRGRMIFINAPRFRDWLIQSHK